MPALAFAEGASGHSSLRVPLFWRKTNPSILQAAPGAYFGEVPAPVAFHFNLSPQKTEASRSGDQFFSNTALPAFSLKSGCWCSSSRAFKKPFFRLFD